MSTKVYGCSDDLIEFEGDLSGEVSCFGTDDEDKLGVLIAFDDGTILSVKFGKLGQSIWGISVLRCGEMFDRLENCVNEDADPYSDVVYFHPGELKAWAGKDGEVVR